MYFIVLCFLKILGCLMVNAKWSTIDAGRALAQNVLACSLLMDAYLAASNVSTKFCCERISNRTSPLSLLQAWGRIPCTLCPKNRFPCTYIWIMSEIHKIRHLSKAAGPRGFFKSLAFSHSKNLMPSLWGSQIWDLRSALVKSSHTLSLDIQLLISLFGIRITKNLFLSFSLTYLILST